MSVTATDSSKSSAASRRSDEFMTAAKSVNEATGAKPLQWGPEGHRIIASLAWARLSKKAQAKVQELLGPNVTLESIASWADEVRPKRPTTGNWHFVNIPKNVQSFDRAKECADSPKGDCIIAEMERCQRILKGKRDEKGNKPTKEEQAEALKFFVHFVGDAEQPMHTAADGYGGNAIKVDPTYSIIECEDKNKVVNYEKFSLHNVWDGGMLRSLACDAKDYASYLDKGWMKSEEAKQIGKAAKKNNGTPEQWTLESHKVLPQIWKDDGKGKLTVIDDSYIKTVRPIMDKQLGLASIRLAQALNDILGD